MAKQKTRSYMLNREKYKAIKKYDHQQMESFCSSVYESGVRDGYEAGCKAAAEAASGELAEKFKKSAIAEVLDAAAQVKGIGPKKLEEIRARIEGVRNEE